MEKHYTPYKHDLFLTTALLAFFLCLQTAHAGQKTAWYKGSFTADFSYSRSRYESLDEPYTYSPLQPQGSGSTSTTQIEWTRNWEEEYYLFTPAYAISPFKYVAIQIGVSAGVCDSSFNAATVNAVSSTSETWYMDDAFAWGPRVNLIVATNTERGGYLKIGYKKLHSEDDEDKEILISDFGNSGNDRDAFFKWQTETYEVETGYKLKRLTAGLGARVTRFKSKKWLTHHIDESNAEGPRQKEIIQQLNSEPSHYHYTNTEEFTPYASLQLNPVSNIYIELICGLDDTEQYSAVCSLKF